jgi:hypothetical protein
MRNWMGLRDGVVVRRTEQALAPDRAGRGLVTAFNKLSRFLHYNITYNKPAAICQREIDCV